MSVMKQFLKKSGSLAAMTVVAGLGMADMANAQVRPDNGGTPVGTCNGQPCEPVTPTTPGTTVTTGDVTNTATGGNATNTTDVDVNNSATGGNAVVGDTTATVGDTTSTATANNGGQSLNNTITHEAAVTAIAPTAVATGSNNVTCGEQIGFSIGVAVTGFGLSAGANLPAGVNAECMTNVRATTIIGAGVGIYGVNQGAGADTIAVGIGVMMQADDMVRQSVDHVSSMGCTDGNPINRFADNCGRSGAVTYTHGAPTYKP